MAASYRLLAQYKDLCKDVAAKEPPFKLGDAGVQRKNDHEAIQNILKKQGEKVKVEMHQLLHGDDGENADGNGELRMKMHQLVYGEEVKHEIANSHHDSADGFRKEEDTFWTRFAEEKAKGDEQDNGHDGKSKRKDVRSWASLADNTRKAVRQLVRDIPEHVD